MLTGKEPAMPSDYIITDSFGNVEGIEEKRWSGLTIRQHFAGQIMAGHIAGYIGNSDVKGMEWSTIAKECVAATDALIAELNKP